MRNFAIALLASAANAANYLTAHTGWLPDPAEHSHFKKVWEKVKIPKGSIVGYEFKKEDEDFLEAVEICSLIPATIPVEYPYIKGHVE